MEKQYNHKDHESRIYKMWEDGEYFKAKIDKNKTPYTIILPPPNASGKMHTGNVLMIAIEDLLIRWKRMKGYSVLWIPGTDHAGFETQITFEKELKKNGKSRFDYDRNSMYKEIWDFVYVNKELIENQIKQMGASVDWSRYKFTLDDDVINTVSQTFERMYSEGLVYRDDYMVNYCPKCGTTFADLEVTHTERKDPLYYVKYQLENSDKFVTVATVRPETIFIDTHLAVNPKDEKWKHLIGNLVINPLTGKPMSILADEFVEMDFGTSIVKLTPAHDKADYEVAKKHNLPIIPMLDLNGRVNSAVEEFENLKLIKGEVVVNARMKIVEILKEGGSLEKVDDNYSHTVSLCYKAGHDIEPTILPNWFIRVSDLKKPAGEVVKNGDVKIYPKWQERKYMRWIEDMHDWPISRQVVWGIRIPAWYNVSRNPNIVVSFLNSGNKVISGKLSEILKTHSYEEIEAGLQTLIAPKNAEVEISLNKPVGEYLQETDTFDTWFSSGHWPLVTLGFSYNKDKISQDFEYFYPTAVLETGWEIIRPWVSRMIMFGIYATNKPPFRDVYLHGLVRARDGKKMSKSLGNVINPDEYMEEYGVDALRMGLISGTANGKDFSFPHDRVLAYRKFANKLWNMARFMDISLQKSNAEKYISIDKSKLSPQDEEIVKKLQDAINSVDLNLAKYRFSQAGEIIYHFVWDDLASDYLENSKNREDVEVFLSVLKYCISNTLHLLHPFMPFVTEAIWDEIKDSEEKPLIVSNWPKAEK